jgi:Ca-activated chloride channel homolog
LRVLTKKFWFLLIAVALLASAISSPSLIAWSNTVFHVDAGVVVVSFTVRDSHGNYVNKLSPSQIRVREDGVEQRLNSFSEAEVSSSAGSADRAADPEHAALSSMPSSVFILFDTSNCMYETFARSEDAIENFIRHLSPSQSVAVYSFSHNMTRLARLTNDHEQAIRGLRTAAAGDSTAVLNATLLTLRDAAQVPGRKVVVIFSNGPDDSSVLNPGDVSRIAEEEGVPIYIIATRVNKICEEAFQMLADASGGRLFLAANRPAQMDAFQAIGDDLKHTYTLTYRPGPNAKDGWRHIQIEVLGDAAKDYTVRSRTGYRPIRQIGD